MLREMQSILALFRVKTSGMYYNYNYNANALYDVIDKKEIDVS